MKKAKTAKLAIFFGIALAAAVTVALSNTPTYIICILSAVMLLSLYRIFEFKE
jgi:hypothetical protein